jgi:DNA-binding transcriptional ArsR family regulator
MPIPKNSLEVVLTELRSARETLTADLADLDTAIATLERMFTPSQGNGAVHVNVKRSKAAAEPKATFAASAPATAPSAHIGTIPAEDELREGTQLHRFLQAIKKRPLSALELCKELGTEISVVYALASVLRKKGLMESKSSEEDGTRRYYPL